MTIIYNRMIYVNTEKELSSRERDVS